MPRLRHATPAPRRHGLTRTLRTALSTTLAVTALLGLPATFSSSGLDVVADLPAPSVDGTSAFSPAPLVRR